MSFSRIRELLEVMLTPANLKQFAGISKEHLTDADQYKIVVRLAPKLAQQLLIAWQGDASSYKSSGGKNFESVFKQFLTDENLQKYAPELKIDHAIAEAFKMLSAFADASFPKVDPNTKVDNSVWQNEKWAKEAEEFDMAEYNLLKEELLK